MDVKVFRIYCSMEFRCPMLLILGLQVDRLFATSNMCIIAANTSGAIVMVPKRFIALIAARFQP